MRTKILFGVITAVSGETMATSFAPHSSPPRHMQKIHMAAFRGGSTEEENPEEAIIDLDAEPEIVIPASSSPMGPEATVPGLLRRSFPSIAWHRLPNILTYIRCFAIPALIALFYMPGRHVESSVLFAFASYTDWLDGYLARRWDISSDFGAFLDPVADKLTVSTSLVLLTGRYGAELAIPTCIILARELAVSALREWMAQKGKRDIVKVGMQGKVKTALTMSAITILLLAPTTGTGPLTQLYMPGLLMMYFCALITITSGSVYFIAAAPLLLDK